MAEICCDVVGESEVSSPCEKSSRVARRRRMEIRQFKFVADVAASSDSDENEHKRQRLDRRSSSSAPHFVNAVQNICSEVEQAKSKADSGKLLMKKEIAILNNQSFPAVAVDTEMVPKYGVASVRGRRRDMEDAVAIHPSFFRREREREAPVDLHFFGVYDGHGCSHVAAKCEDRLHELVKEELESGEASSDWRRSMERSFSRMDQEAVACSEGAIGAGNCRCELQTPKCNAVGSTAVVSVIAPDEIIVANCGDSRAVLCRNGLAIPLSIDHKPDRPDELNRIESGGGRVIYWDGARVLGVLAMSRAIGDNYLKPYVISEPEVTITERCDEDECLILASDGLWDVVKNETACAIARMCLTKGSDRDKACSDAAMLLTKLAMARLSSDNVSVVVIDLRKKKTTPLT